MSIPIKAKGTLRTLKNMTFNYSEIQVKVRDATSNDPVGPNAKTLSEIARATFSHHTFIEVMEILDKRLDDAGKQWRHVFKALTLMEYLVQFGSEEALNHFKSNLYRIKTLREFQYIDDQARDQGSNVRHKANSLTELLTDDSKLRGMRKGINNQMNNNYGNNNNNTGGFGSTGYASGSGYNYNENQTNYPSGGYGSMNSSYLKNNKQHNMSDEDRDLQLAIEESKKMAERNPIQRTQTGLTDNSDKDLQYALELSKREAEKEAQMREQSIAKENELVLLDDYNPNEKNTSAVSHLKQYDFFGNIIHDPNSKSGTADLLGLDPLAFSSNTSYNTSNYNTSYNSMSSFNQSNPFHQNNNPMNHHQVNTNIFQLNQQQQGNQNNNNNNTATGFNSQFNNQFDGGFKAKLLPHQKVNNANTALAEVARNSSKIDPFASFAAERDNNNNSNNNSSNNLNLFNSNSPNNNKLGMNNNSLNNNPFQMNANNNNNNNNLFTNNNHSNSSPSLNQLFNNPSPMLNNNNNLNNSLSNDNLFGNINNGFDSTTTGNTNNSNPFGSVNQNQNQNQQSQGQGTNIFF